MKVKPAWIVLAVIALILLIVGASMVGTYNSLVTERTAVETQSKQVDVQYQRSFNLLPQITQLAQQYLQNESAVQTKVAALRSGSCGTAGAASGSDLNAKDQCAQQVQETSNLIIKVVNENYPQLQSVQLYRDVQTETINTANKIATEKVRYNELAGTYNTHVQKCCLPVMVAGMFHFEKAQLIGFSDRQNQSSFGNHTL